MTRIVKGAIVVEQAWLVRYLRSRGTIGMILLWALFKVAPFRWLMRCRIDLSTSAYDEMLHGEGVGRPILPQCRPTGGHQISRASGAPDRLGLSRRFFFGLTR